jgi:thiol-disulfide isomerase/thioredoxin
MNIFSRGAATALLLATLLSSTATAQAEDRLPGQPAPAWALSDLAGGKIDSGDFKGKVLVVDFWATWCGPCRSEIPGYVSLQKQYGPDGLVVVGVSLDQDTPAATAREAVQRFADQMKINYRLAIGDDRIAEAFGGVEAIPTTFIIDREGRIAFHKVGAMPQAQFAAELKRVLAQAGGAGVNP